MNKEIQNGYMLLFRGTDWHKGLSAEEMQKVAGQWMDWFKKLSEQGKVSAGHPLEAEGKIVSGKGGRMVADGPFAESKEAIGGYFLLQVDRLDEALAIAKECPGLAYGATVEVRPVRAECPMMREAQSEPQLASATA
ncbi:MAG TPA: YciI family protein [Candidatus Saccharimonadales bacterium]|nr:YciI family protein [Candidatus Saccharimonadales bacterium]